MKFTWIAIAIVALAAACATSEKKPLAPTPVTPPPAAAPKPHEAPPTSTTRSGQTSEAAPKTPPLYFAFDDATLQSQRQDALRQLGGYLVKHPEAHILVEGNTDDVGTAEYNIALGQRRANAAVEYLKRLGVKNEQIRMISYGEEKPAANGTGETVWAQNRRDEVKPGS